MNDRLRETGAVTITLRKRIHALMQDGFQEAHFDGAIDARFFASPRKPRNSAAKLEKAVNRHVRVRRRIFRQIADEAFGRDRVGRGCRSRRRVTLPSEGGMKPVIMRMVVDLPAPLGPRKPGPRRSQR